MLTSLGLFYVRRLGNCMFIFKFFCIVVSPIFFAHSYISSILIKYGCMASSIGAWWVECSPIAQETGAQSQVESYQRLKKMVHDTSLLNTQPYKVCIKGKVEQSMESNSVVAIEKGAFGSLLTTVANFYMCQVTIPI